jgi:hypothetical protein
MELDEKDKGATLVVRGERVELKLQGTTAVLGVEGIETRGMRRRGRRWWREGETQDVRIVIEVVRRIYELEGEADVFDERGKSALVVREEDGEGEGSVQKRKLGNFGEF